MARTSPPRSCPLASDIAEELRRGREQLTRRWLDRVTARVSMDPERVFPTNDLLDHMPLLLTAIADFIEDPADEITADMPVVGKAMELGQMRYDQGFDAHEIMKEYEILGGMMFARLTETVDVIERPCTRSELLECAHRLFRGIAIIQQVTTNHYLRVLRERVQEREDRLRGFNRMVSHELKNRIGTVLNAGSLVGEHWLDAGQRERFSEIVTGNAWRIKTILENLVSLSQMESAAETKRDVLLLKAAEEAVRQSAELARERHVDVRLADDLPTVKVNAAATEICLSNYLSNAIKYADPDEPSHWTEIRGYVRKSEVEGRGRELVVEVHDNGIGVPEAERARLFERFFRAQPGTVTGVEGTGLGLSIVRDVAESLGGEAWAEFEGEETVFAFSMPIDDGGENEGGVEQETGADGYGSPDRPG